MMLELDRYDETIFNSYLASGYVLGVMDGQYDVVANCRQAG